MDALSKANGAFAIQLLKLLGQDNPEHNVFCSPVSISSALAMVLLGAKGSTAAQMVQALGLSSVEDPHGGFQTLLTQVLKLGAPYSLSIANRLFGEESCEFVPSFQESCLRFYKAKMEPLSFAKAPERSRKHINTWVSRKTEGKIPEVLAKNSIDEESRLVLINAVYFKGKWDEPFDKSYTRKMPFKINQKEQRPVQMMFQEGKFPRAKVSEVRAQVLELPYVGQELSMVLVLPDEGVDLSTVEKSLTFEKLQTWTSPEQMERTKVEVFLPRFKLQEDYDMGTVLQALGMVDAFQVGKADLSGMVVDSELCLSKVVHRSVVEVNEEVTEAAAATAVMIQKCCAMELPVFCADHPFLFFIRHNATHSLLFCGRFASP
ncbi:serpin B9 [Cavia porcellus]|uniref:serpin B9 n=1 Tax=Cavia porcellus TaxID=10141 RepID=UPI00022B55E7|nr:serpin B9 [Cavia porcellus]XP_023420469.1 serpin B9 [Cavia porcellus]